MEINCCCTLFVEFDNSIFVIVVVFLHSCQLFCSPFLQFCGTVIRLSESLWESTGQGTNVFKHSASADVFQFVHHPLQILFGIFPLLFFCRGLTLPPRILELHAVSSLHLL
eukprot:GHVQ01025331.1.p1 GENE.GHVQ01025331.1~~GHVQ01025331.1.p1  ORF type:complete len:111 (-),score=6.51 GHVQ01025331.1:670-1002(-)